jgi:hypothetical protein
MNNSQHLDLSNIGLIDNHNEYHSNTFGDVLASLGNSSGGSGSTASGGSGGAAGGYAQAAQTALSLGTQLAQNSAAKKAAKAASDPVYATCGRKPLFKKKRQKWQKCADNVNAQQQAANKANTTPAQTPTTTYTDPSTNYTQPAKKKFLGMPMAVGITVTVVAVVGLAFGGIKLAKHLKASKVVVSV